MIFTPGSAQKIRRNTDYPSTRIDNLHAWAKENGHTIAGEYIDAGISGKKPLSKRPALYRWIQEVEAGRKVDALVFTKLDRFFRSVKLYYQATSIMDAHGIAWQAIQDDYETITSAGRFKVNIMLSVAEAEADRTSERIKVVFERKVAMGEALGSIMPLGLERKDKKVVPNEDADIVRECFKIFLQTASVYKVQRYLLEIGHTISYPATARILHNPLYCGHFRGNNSFCEPIISIADWADAQQIVLQGDFRERYNELCREDKRSLWRSVIDHIEADREGKLTIYFLP